MKALSDLGRLRVGVSGAKLKAAGLPLLKVSQLKSPSLEGPLEPVAPAANCELLERYRLSPFEVVISLAKRPLMASSVPEGVMAFASENFAIWTPHPEYRASSPYVALYLAQHTESQLEGRTTVVHGTTVITLTTLASLRIGLPTRNVQDSLLELQGRLRSLEQAQRAVLTAQRVLFHEVFRSLTQEDL